MSNNWSGDEEWGLRSLAMTDNLSRRKRLAWVTMWLKPTPRASLPLTLPPTRRHEHGCTDGAQHGTHQEPEQRLPGAAHHWRQPTLSTGTLTLPVRRFTASVSSWAGQWDSPFCVQVPNYRLACSLPKDTVKCLTQHNWCTLAELSCL